MSYQFDLTTTALPLEVVQVLEARLRPVRPHRVAAGTDIQHQGDVSGHVYLVQSGSLFAQATLPSGKRQLLALHQRGDLAGLGDLGSDTASTGLRSLRDCVLYKIPKTRITAPDFLTPAVAIHFLHIAARTQRILMENLLAVGRMDARHRILWLVLMLHARASPRQRACAELDLPLTQSEIGDMVGLTNVSVSKTLGALEQDGLIARVGTKLRLPDLPRVRALF
jgi:CRP-like cAMP-binding protein